MLKKQRAEDVNRVMGFIDDTGEVHTNVIMKHDYDPIPSELYDVVDLESIVFQIEYLVHDGRWFWDQGSNPSDTQLKKIKSAVRERLVDLRDYL